MKQGSLPQTFSGCMRSLPKKNGWRLEVLNRHYYRRGWFKEVIALIEGKGVYSHLKFESGVHRVQRVPVTEAQGRIHTSTVTVAILPEAEDVEVQIDPNDIRVDIFRSSGGGSEREHHGLCCPDYSYPYRNRGFLSGREVPA